MPFKKSATIAIAIGVLAFLIRVYRLDSSPEGLYIDETSIGYNAHSIVETARDEHGKFMPLFFEAFGEYKLPVYIYSVALVQLVTGPTDLSVRIPSLFFGVASVFVMYLFAREILGQEAPALLGSFLLAVSPWHFQFSRPGFEASAGLFFTLVGLFLFFRGLNLRSPFWVSLAIISFTVSLYSYNSTRITVPVMGLALLLLYFKDFGLKNWIKICLPSLFLAMPFLVFMASSKGLARARQVSIFYEENVSANRFLSNYLQNISPLYLFKFGDPTIAHWTAHRWGLLYLVEAPFFFLGIYGLLKRRVKSFFFLVFMFFITLVPPAIAILNPHALRGILALSVTPFFTSFGFWTFLKIFRKRHHYLPVVSVFIIIISLSTFSFLKTYHNKYVPDAGWDWQVGIKKTSERVLAMEQNYDDIYFDLDPRTVPSLWYLKIDPSLYQKSIDKNHLAKFHINQNINRASGLYVGFSPPPQSKLLEYVYYPNGSIASGIWEF